MAVLERGNPLYRRDAYRPTRLAEDMELPAEHLWAGLGSLQAAGLVRCDGGAMWIVDKFFHETGIHKFTTFEDRKKVGNERSVRSLLNSLQGIRRDNVVISECVAHYGLGDDSRFAQLVQLNQDARMNDIERQRRRKAEAESNGE